MDKKTKIKLLTDYQNFLENEEMISALKEIPSGEKLIEICFKAVEEEIERILGGRATSSPPPVQGIYMPNSNPQYIPPVQTPHVPQDHPAMIHRPQVPPGEVVEIPDPENPHIKWIDDGLSFEQRALKNREGKKITETRMF